MQQLVTCDICELLIYQYWCLVCGCDCTELQHTCRWDWPRKSSSDHITCYWWRWVGR